MPAVAYPEPGRVPGAPSTRGTCWFLATLLALSLILFAGSASLGLAGDDVGWLHGAPLTAVDAHRVLPRLVFDGLRSLFGPSALAALATIWLLHTLNGLLLYRLARCLLAGREAALAAVADGLSAARDKHGPDSVGFFASARCTNEENYLLQKLARAVVGTNNVDHCARL